ncbi:putative O-glycosylation ligase, exosortase A system-associated [Qipengyuania sp. MTN3-11]|uniref:putative O-glycosylation ligase, exosortase A system-associated n=1 Tax=Qipengyuania sp. MTN3-11 TaxID=3056557 RepID=UPI0036F36FF7
MLDLALFAFVMGILALGITRPFLWVLAYVYIDILAPQKIGWTLTPALPISLIAFVAAFAGWLFVDNKRDLRAHYRQGLMVLLLLYCWYTTSLSQFPLDAAHKWSWVWKALVFAIFLPFTLTTRLRIEAVVLTIVLTLGAIVIATGLKTVGGGGGYENLYFFVNDNSGIYESSTLATVAIGSIPLIVWLMKHGTVFPPDWRVKLFGCALIFACLLIPVGTEARTGLLCIAVLAVLSLRSVKNRIAYIVAAGLLGVLALPFLPQTYYERMATIGSAEGDESASTRVAVWQWTLDFVAENPMGGGFDSYRANSFTYEMPVRTEAGNTAAVQYVEVTDKARAFHSAYFELLGEQGYFGFAIWLLLMLSGLVQMERLRRRYRQRDGPGDASIAQLATALQSGLVIYLVGATFQGIGYQPVVFLFLGLQVALWNWCRRRDAETDAAPRRHGVSRGVGNASPRPDPAMP